MPSGGEKEEPPRGGMDENKQCHNLLIRKYALKLHRSPAMFKKEHL